MVNRDYEDEAHSVGDGYGLAQPVHRRVGEHPRTRARPSTYPSLLTVPSLTLVAICHQLQIQHPTLKPSSKRPCQLIGLGCALQAGWRVGSCSDSGSDSGP